MNVLVDTSVWSLALRRDTPPNIKETQILARCLERQDILFSTGIIVQELLQGFRGPKQRLIEHFSSLPLIVPDLQITSRPQRYKQRNSPQCVLYC